MPNPERDRLHRLFSRLAKHEETFERHFYAALFERNGEIEQLFDRSGMEMPARMVLQALEVAIKSCTREEDFVTIFKGLGRRHAVYGVRADYYPDATEALVDSCRSVLGDGFDSETEADLRGLLRSVTAEMAAGEREYRKRSAKKRYRPARDMPHDPYLARFLEQRPAAPSRPEPMDVDQMQERVKLDYVGETSVETAPMQTILEASLANGIPHICECGGAARCSTCRVLIVEGLDNCLPRNTLESRLAERKGFYPEIRLACQTRVVGDVRLKRLVRDEIDVRMAISGSPGDVGEEIEGAVLFTDIQGFTSFAEHNLPYDVIHALNHLFRSLGRAVDKHGGYVDKYIGDNLMAIFGLAGEDAQTTCENAVRCATEMLNSLPSVNGYLRNYLDSEFHLGVGIAYGPMVTGEVGFSKKRQFTAIGDTVNIAARLEAETRNHEENILVSDAVLRNLPRGMCVPRETFEFALKGKRRKVVAHAISVS